jgi:hypothetical protein
MVVRNDDTTIYMPPSINMYHNSLLIPIEIAIPLPTKKRLSTQGRQKQTTTKSMT